LRRKTRYSCDVMLLSTASHELDYKSRKRYSPKSTINKGFVPVRRFRRDLGEATIF
jgi:hypothetical protein